MIKDSIDSSLYNKYFERFEKAYNEAFYIQAICIIYAIFENELKEFLYLSGVINSKLAVTKRFRKDYKKMWGLKDSDKFGINKISRKRDYILKILEYAENKIMFEFAIKKHENYFSDLSNTLSKNVNLLNLRYILEKIKNWCELRNKVIHNLLNQNLDELDDTLKVHAKDGESIAKELLSILEKYKNIIDLRTKYKIQDC